MEAIATKAKKVGLNLFNKSSLGVAENKQTFQKGENKKEKLWTFKHK